MAARAGFRRFFSISAFSPPTPAAAPPAAEPSTNLFVSGKTPYSFLISFLVAMVLLSFFAFAVGYSRSCLNKRTTSEALSEAFSKFGQVINARVVTDRISGYSKGFGFVRYATLEEAGEGIKGMDGKVNPDSKEENRTSILTLAINLIFLDGWVIFAEYARPRPPPPQMQQQPPSVMESTVNYQ
ncbi:hypothetical protein ZIOFF_073349 [Zingiber officinale]|uniref:RRM domain-containing protein n=1 Tax=Zingiber officinale TaxID=94328 RepID=A0A8J5EA66_ZINOF|nr:hypothetical protein ZIOFF_073349 [Zingiber officinale]